MIEENILISRIKRKFKGETYKNIANMTGINITRVFRIFNGSKISYREAIVLYKIIDPSKTGESSFISKGNAKSVKAKILRLSRLEKIAGQGE